MPDRHHAVLHVQPEAIPRLRELFVECLDLLGERLTDLSRSGRMLDAWMHDPVSLRMRDVYNERVMDADDGGYAALRAYEAELKRVFDELGRMEAEYRRTEDTAADLFDSRT